MQSLQLKKDYRDALISNYRLRCAVAVDAVVDQTTLKRQAANNSIKLIRKDVQESLRKHLGLSRDTVMTEPVEIEVHPEA